MFQFFLDTMFPKTKHNNALDGLEDLNREEIISLKKAIRQLKKSQSELLLITELHK